MSRLLEKRNLYAWKTLSIHLLLGCLAPTGFAQSLLLVEDGEPNSVIVLAADASPAAERGAKILGDHIFQISGARLPTGRAQPDGRIILSDKKDPDRNTSEEALIAVGESSLTEQLGVTSEGLLRGGIMMKSFPSALVLLGADDPDSSEPNGTQHAVTTFLEQELGVRFLWPGEMGKVVPKKKTLEIGKVDLRFSPSITQRKIRMGATYTRRMSDGGEKMGVTAEEYEKLKVESRETHSEDRGWATWHRLGGSLNLASGHAFGHLWEAYGKRHPEWFAMNRGGSRDQSASPDRARLCVSNPDLAKAIAKELIEKIRDTGQTSVSIGPNDGGTTSFCTCDACEALDAGTDRRVELIDFSDPKNRVRYEHVPLTDRYVHFWNAIAEDVVAVYPDVWLTADGYSAYRSPPVKAKLHPNIAIRYVGVSYVDESARQQGMKDWHAWAKAADKLYYRSNCMLAGRRQGTPAVYPHKLAEDIRTLAANRMIGTDFDACLHHWSTQGINFYVLAKLLWNPEANVDEILDDYFQSGFGAGADAVKQYFTELEKLTDKVASGKLAMTEPYTPETIDRLRKLLDQAAEATSGDPESLARVEFLRVGLDYTNGYAEIYRIDKEWQKKGGRLSDEMKERSHLALNRNWETSRRIFHEHHLAVNTPYVAWGSWGYFKRFQWEPPTAE